MKFPINYDTNHLSNAINYLNIILVSAHNNTTISDESYSHGTNLLKVKEPIFLILKYHVCLQSLDSDKA